MAFDWWNCNYFGVRLISLWVKLLFSAVFPAIRSTAARLNETGARVCNVQYVNTLFHTQYKSLISNATLTAVCPDDVGDISLHSVFLGRNLSWWNRQEILMMVRRQRRPKWTPTRPPWWKRCVCVCFFYPNSWKSAVCMVNKMTSFKQRLEVLS